MIKLLNEKRFYSNHMSELIFDIDPQIFIENFLSQFPHSGTKPIIKLIRELVIEQIEYYLSEQVGSGKIVRFTIYQFEKGLNIL